MVFSYSGNMMKLMCRPARSRLKPSAKSSRAALCQEPQLKRVGSRLTESRQHYTGYLHVAIVDLAKTDSGSNAGLPITNTRGRWSVECAECKCVRRCC